MSARCRITRDPLDPAALLDRFVAPGDGAALLFLGVVREESEGRMVSGLEYQAYAPMAESEMERIVDEARERWRTGEIVITHRVGALAVGEASVAIVVAAPHRAEAYEASRYVLEQLKRRVPIWKRESFLEGPSEWVPGVDPGGGAP